MQFTESQSSELSDRLYVKGTASQGITVVNRAGELIGTVENATCRNGTRMPYALVALDGEPGLEDKLIIVPWQILEPDPARGRFTLIASEDRLIGAPGCDRTRWPDMSDPLLRHAVRVHYGYGPLTGTSHPVDLIRHS